MRMNKECPYPRGIPRRIELRVRFRTSLVNAVERAAFAPSPAPNDLPILFNYIIGAIADQLVVDAKNRSQRSLDLWRRIMLCLKDSR